VWGEQEQWANSGHLQHVPVYYASQLAKKALAVFSTYITYMNHKIRQAAQTRNPFDFRHVHSLQEG
jgi:cleavage and polyadenylation specificity factor subunit 3